MANTVVGIFDNIDRARAAASELEQKGYHADRIDISPQGNLNRSGEIRQENSFSRFFKSLFEDEQEAERYAEASDKAWVVTFHAENMEQAVAAAEILDQNDALNPDERSGRKEERISGKENETSVPVIEERMDVGKRREETGGIRLRSRIIERPVEEHLRLRTEHIEVERNPVNRPVTAADLDTFKEGTVEAVENSEVSIVNKEARVVEEIKLKKKVEERDETVRGTVRKQDIDVERKSRKDKELRREDEDKTL